MVCVRISKMCKWSLKALMHWTRFRMNGGDPMGFIGRDDRQLLRNCEDRKEENGDAGGECGAGARQPPHHRGDLQGGQP